MNKPQSPPRPPPESWMIRRAEDMQKEVENLILTVPTSERRNKQTEVNIHLMEAITKLKEARHAA